MSFHQQYKTPFERESGREYLLYLSSYYPHKNVEIINQVVPILEAHYPGKFVFVLTLPAKEFDNVIDNSILQSVINMGPVRPEECPGLYQACDYTFIPTLLECFSASYAESMAMDRPILTSDMGFAKTVCKDAAIYFDPIDPKDIAEKINQLSLNQSQCEELVELGRERLQSFPSAKERAVKYIEVCAMLTSDLKLKLSILRNEN